MASPIAIVLLAAGAAALALFATSKADPEGGDTPEPPRPDPLPVDPATPGAVVTVLRMATLFTGHESILRSDGSWRLNAGNGVMVAIGQGEQSMLDQWIAKTSGAVDGTIVRLLGASPRFYVREPGCSNFAPQRWCYGTDLQRLRNVVTRREALTRAIAQARSR